MNIAKGRLGFIEPTLALAGCALTRLELAAGRLVTRVVCQAHPRVRLARDQAAGLKVYDDRETP